MAGRPWRVALIAGSILVLELAFIRLIPAEVRVLSYFPNLILMAAFFGLGLGCILERQRSLEWLLPAGLLVIFALLVSGRGMVIYPETGEVHYWLMYGADRGQPRLPLFPAALACFLAGAVPFVALGQRLAREIGRHERLRAYGWDLGGSLLGVAVFTGGSFLRIPPWIWPPLVMLGWIALGNRTLLVRLAAVASGMLFLAFGHSPQPSIWSPYYLVQYEPTRFGTRVWVNSGFHQFGFDFHARVPEELHRHREALLAKWQVPYDLYRAAHQGRPPARVLVLGAGTGNDVAVALAGGASHVTAVEIDPVILELGRRYNARREFADPRVVCRVDDARHFLRTATETFDLIVFGTLDSHAQFAPHGNLRLENYVYTREALQDARRRINPGGLVAVFYSAQKPWLYERLEATFRSAFPQSRLYTFENHDLFNLLLVGTSGEGPFDGFEPATPSGSARPATDDWPFIYLERPMIGGLYQRLMLVVLLLVAAVFGLLRRLEPARGFPAAFLFLGAGFSLLQAAAIVRLALIFGSTWTVHAAVFSAMLLMMCFANGTVRRGWAPGLRVSWCGLCAAIAFNYLFPLSALLAVAPAARAAACVGLIGVPVYFASVCFSRLFQRALQPGFPLGLNLIGAMLGGWIEYASLVIGMRSVWLLIVAVYALAWVAAELARNRGGPRVAGSEVAAHGG